MNENYFSSPQSTASQADERTQTLTQHTRFWVATKFYLKSFVFGEMQKAKCRAVSIRAVVDMKRKLNMSRLRKNLKCTLLRPRFMGEIERD